MTEYTWTCLCGAQRTSIRYNSQSPSMPGWTNHGPPTVAPKCPDCVQNNTPIFRALCEELKVTVVRQAA